MLITLLAGAAALVPGASVDETAPPSIVVTGTRLPEGASELTGRPGGTDLVTAEEYRNKAAVSLRDALAFSSGVYAQPRFGQEVRLSIRGSGISRGYHMRGLTLLQDGIPINLADDNGDFQELDPTILDRLEVYRGASAFRFGGTTLGGAINGVTPTGRTSPGVRVRADGGSFDTVRGLVSVGVAGKEVDGWLAVNGDRSDGDRAHARRAGLRFNGNLGWQPAATVQTRFYVGANRLRQELPGALTYDIVRSRPETGSLVGDQARDIDSLRVQNRTTVRLGSVDLEGGVFANWKRLHHPIFQVVEQDSVDRGLFGRIGWTRGVLQLLGGVTARFGTVDSKRFVNLDGKSGARTFVADQTARTIDVYGEGRLGLGAGLTAIAGGVYTDGKRRQEQRIPIAVTGSARFEQFSPRLGLLWETGKRMQLFANLSRSHELPGFIELAQVAAFVPLRAQHAWTADVGARGSIGDVRLDVSLYRARVRDELLQFTVSADIPASTFNAGRTIHQGIEAGLEAPLASWARLRATYQFNDFRFDRDRQYGDNRLPVIPKHLLRTDLRFGPEKWGVAPSVEWVPQGAFADYRNSFRTGGYALLGLTGSMAIDGRSEVFADLRNLANRKAAGDVGAVISWNPGSAIFYPVERRAVFLGLRTRLSGGAR
ncbi:TonB-dependent receptor [Sphingomonas rosea]|uniref:TonB-dependent receptor n=1 Tax=Sphingomonas rosea TaxID=335605 RepID=A0ABP7TNP6_9SPHN